ncbi:MAG: CBS domain-containing protein [Gemmatimonadota bacterium]
MSVGRICTRVVATAGGEEKVAEAARRMVEHNVGTLVVVDADSKPRGILTDRDIVIRCVARNLSPEDASVGEIMTAPVRSVDESTPIEQVLGTMEGAGTRRMVVTGKGGTLAGLVSVDDILELLGDEVSRIAGILAREAPVLTPRT